MQVIKFHTPLESPKYYNNVKKFKSHKNTKYLTLAFQRRFRQSLVNGKIDKECLLISKNLL